MREDLVRLKTALYGANGLFPDVRYSEVTSKIGRVIKWRPPRARMRSEWIRREDLERYLQNHS